MKLENFLSKLTGCNAGAPLVYEAACLIFTETEESAPTTSGFLEMVQDYLQHVASWFIITIIMLVLLSFP